MDMDILVPLLWFHAQNQATRSAATQRPRQHRRPRAFRRRLCLQDFTEEECIHHFRLDKNAIQDLFLKVEHLIEKKTCRSKAIDGMTKLLSVLHYFASASFQYCVAYKMGFTQPSFSRILRQVVDAICSLSPIYIRFPYTTAEITAMKQQFYSKHGFPKTIGLIDCTHIALLPPNAIESSYRNRKLYHSLNVQVICGANGEIIDIVAKFPGGTHDSFILGNSGIGQLFHSGFFQDSVLLGDNGYRLTPWLLTPYLNPRNEVQQRYNACHRRTRSQIERVFGLLKSRFRCLDVSGGALLYHPVLVGKITHACAILHNIAIKYALPLEICEDLREPIECPPLVGHENSAEGNWARNQLASAYFS